MSVINKKPIVEEIIESLSDTNTLVSLLNSPIENYQEVDENNIDLIDEVVPVIIMKKDNSILTGLFFGKVNYFLAYNKNTEYFGVYSYQDKSLCEIKGQDLSISELRMYTISSKVEVDQVLDSNSENAVSGKAVAEALEDLTPELPKFVISDVNASGTCSVIPSITQVNKAHAVYITDSSNNITLLRVDSSIFEHSEVSGNKVITRMLNGATGAFVYNEVEFANVDEHVGLNGSLEVQGDASFKGAVEVQEPTADGNPATKSYVDNAVASASSIIIRRYE